MPSTSVDWSILMKKRKARVPVGTLAHYSPDMVETLAKDAEYLEIEQADTQFILVSGPGLVIHSLVEQGVLALEPDSEEAEED